MKRGEVSAPLYVRIKPTNSCNHRCFYCSYGNPEARRDHVAELRAQFHPQDQLDLEIMMNLIRDLGEMKVKAVTFSGGGEPLVYPHIEEAMQSVLDHRIDLSVITNGTFLCDKKADILRNAKWVRISMDSCRAGNYARIRGIKEEIFHKIAENIKSFARKKNKDCELGINFVITPDNADEIYDMAAFAKDLSVNHLKMCAVITPDILKTHGPIREGVLEQIRRAETHFQDQNFRIINKYEDDLAVNAVFERTYCRCPIQQIVPVVAADANVYFCHDKAYVPGGELGSLKEKSFKEIWFSEATQKRFREFDAGKECRHHCVYDQRNILINSYLDLDESQINFI